MVGTFVPTVSYSRHVTYYLNDIGETSGPRLRFHPAGLFVYRRSAGAAIIPRDHPRRVRGREHRVPRTEELENRLLLSVYCHSSCESASRNVAILDKPTHGI